MRKVVAVCSGGLDSTTAAMFYKRRDCEVIMLHFNYGQKAQKAEVIAVNRIAERVGMKVKMVDLKDLGSFGSSALTDEGIEVPEGDDSIYSFKCWVPARNVVFLAYASAFAESIGANLITFGAEKSESGYPDNTQEFVDRFNRMLEYGCIKKVRVEIPLRDMVKTEIVKLGVELGVPLELVWSCDFSGEIPCGRCGCCVNRKRAFKRAGFVDPQKYEDESYGLELSVEELEELEERRLKEFKEVRE